MLILFYIAIILLMVIFALMLVFQLNKRKLEKDIKRFVETYDEISDSMNYTVSTLTVQYNEKITEMRSVMRESRELLSRFEQIRDEQNSKMGCMQDLLTRMETAKSVIIREISQLKDMADIHPEITRIKPPVKTIRVVPQNEVLKENVSIELNHIEQQVYFSQDEIEEIAMKTSFSSDPENAFQENFEIETSPEIQPIENEEFTVKNRENEKEKDSSVIALTSEEVKISSMKKKTEKKAVNTFQTTVCELKQLGLSPAEIAGKTGRSVLEIKMVLNIVADKKEKLG